MNDEEKSVRMVAITIPIRKVRKNLFGVSMHEQARRMGVAVEDVRTFESGSNYGQEFFDNYFRVLDKNWNTGRVEE